MSGPSVAVEVISTDLADATQAAAFIVLMEHYAQDPMGGGMGLSDVVRVSLVERLREIPHFYSALAWQGDRPVGLVNCFFGFSTFAAEPLLNIHDLVVHADVRGGGVAQALLQHVEAIARETACCKITLEVLSGNRRALASYERAGFAPYQLDPAAGQALFLQKKL